MCAEVCNTDVEACCAPGRQQLWLEFQGARAEAQADGKVQGRDPGGYNHTRTRPTHFTCVPDASFPCIHMIHAYIRYVSGTPVSCVSSSPSQPNMAQATPHTEAMSTYMHHMSYVVQAVSHVHPRHTAVHKGVPVCISCTTQVPNSWGVLFTRCAPVLSHFMHQGPSSMRAQLVL